MFTIIGADGKEYGPVPTGKVQDWIAGGRANLLTRARRDGETDWKTLGDFTEFGAAAIPPPITGSPAVPTVAGEALVASTPVAAQPIPLVGDARAIAADLIARSAPLDVFDCLGKSWNLWLANFLPLVGVTLLVMVVQFVVAFIPLLGAFAGPFLNGVFYGGLYYYYLGKIRGEPREIGDVFAGFSKAFVPLMLTSLLITFITIVLMAVFFGPWLLLLIPALASGHGTIPPLPGGGLLLGFLAGMLALVFISVCWSFAFVLVIDKGLGPWTALEVSRRVVTKQWFRVFFVMLLGAFLTMLGILGLFIGILFTLPLMIGAILYAYEGLCNPPPRAG
jgi:hypothetical protein